MKRKNMFLTVVLLVLIVGCERNKQSDNEIITVDVLKVYPTKELFLQDFMDVEYIALETTDEFLTQGVVLDVGEKYLLVKNRNQDGDIFIFDRKTGKGLRKLNRQGQGPEEYARIRGIILDEDKNEIFVNSLGNKILVYDLQGKFKRCLDLHREVSSVFDYDETNLICYDMSDYYNKGKNRSKPYHLLVSKQDGSVVREILLPFETIHTPIVNKGGNFVANYSYQVRPTRGKWILMDPSTDTLYNYVKGTVEPFLVRTPPIHAMMPEVYLYMGISTDRYDFMQTVENVFDFEKGNGFDTDELVYDREERKVFRAVVYNADYVEKKPVAMTGNPVNREIESVTTLNAFRLIELYRKDQLKDGRLKEIASHLHEEDNPVIMLVKQKN